MKDLLRSIWPPSLLLLTLLWGADARAGRGVVITLEAPLFLRPEWGSPIVQRVRKGDNIYINPLHFDDGGEIREFNEQDPFSNEEATQRALTVEKKENEMLPEEVLNGDFYLTIDHNGQSAYVPKRYVKLITNDEREENESVRPFRHDPTDYRLPEPLPENYPLSLRNHYRGLLYIGGGPQTHDTYGFPAHFQERKYSNNFEFTGAITRRADIYNLDLLYFGGIISFQFANNTYRFQNGDSAEEMKTELGVGPFLSYDTFRTERHRLTFFGAMLFYFLNNVNLSLANDRGNDDSRTFSNVHLASKFGVYYQYVHFYSDFDFLAGSSLKVTPSQTLKSSDPINVDTLWNADDPDTIKYDLHAELSIFVGLQTSY